MTGSVVFSVDAELAWGVHDLHPLSDEQVQRCQQARTRWRQLLDLFEMSETPATWAIVGHLLTDDWRYGTSHPLYPEWFEVAYDGFENDSSQWLGRDLIDAVALASVEHEIASHSFSHVIFPEIDAAVAAAECRLARTVGNQYGFECTSFVFPRNKIAHRDVLAECGFTCYRGLRPSRLPAIPGLRGLGLLAGSLTGGVTPPTVTPVVDEFGLVNVPASMFLGGFRGQPWSSVAAVTADPAVKLARKGIDRAGERDELFHMWLHPNDLTSQRYIDRVSEILAYVELKRRQGDIRVETMADVARRVSSTTDTTVGSAPTPVERTVREQ